MKPYIVILSNGEIHYVNATEDEIKEIINNYNHLNGYKIEDYYKSEIEIDFSVNEFINRVGFTK